MEHSSNVTLALADASTFDAFKQELKASFSVAVEEAFGAVEPGLIPSDDDIDRSLTAPDAVVHHILLDGEKVGGAIVTLEASTQRNTLDLFYLLPNSLGRGGLPCLASYRAGVPRHAGMGDPHAVLRKAQHPLLCQQV